MSDKNLLKKEIETIHLRLEKVDFTNYEKIVERDKKYIDKRIGDFDKRNNTFIMLLTGLIGIFAVFLAVVAFMFNSLKDVEDDIIAQVKQNINTFIDDQNIEQKIADLTKKEIYNQNIEQQINTIGQNEIKKLQKTLKEKTKDFDEFVVSMKEDMIDLKVTLEEGIEGTAIKERDIIELMNKAFREAEEKRYDKAIEAYQKVVNLNPKNEIVYYNMGIVYDKKENYDKAIEAYKKAIEINPKDDDSYNYMGRAYHEKGDYEKAKEAYQKAIEINPNNNDSYNNLFEVFLILERPPPEDLVADFNEKFVGANRITIKFDALEILKKISQKSGKDIEVELAKFEEKYKGVIFENWSWEPIEKWIEKKPNNQKLKETLEFFKSFGK